MAVLIRYFSDDDITALDWVGAGIWTLFLFLAVYFAIRYYREGADQKALLAVSATQARYHESIARISSAAVSDQALTQFMESSLRDVALTLHGDIGNLVELTRDDPHHPQLTVTASVGIDPYPPGTQWEPGAHGIVGLTLLLNKGVMSSDVGHDHRFQPHPEFMARGVTSAICSLVPNLQGKRWGIISVMTKRPRWFADTDLNYLNTVAAMIGHTIERRTTEERYRLLADSEQEIVFTKDPHGQVTYLSPSVERVIGYTAEELMAQPKGFIRTVVHPDDASLVADICTHQEKTYDVLARLHCRIHQAYRWFDIHAEPVTDGFFKGWRGTARHVHDRVTAELRLQDERVRYANIIETAMDAIVMINGNDEILVFNPAAEKMFGVDANDAIGSSMLRFVPQDQRQSYIEGMSVFRHAGYPEDVVQSPPQGSRALRADGTEFPCEVTITFSKVDGQHVYTAIIRDVTDREHIEDMRHNLINMTAHEVRTPLTAIMGHAQLLERSRDPEVIRESARRIRLEATQINDLVTSLIESDPAKMGDIPIHRTLFDLRDIVREQVERMTAAYDIHRDRITMELPDGPVTGTWDRMQLGQGLANLIDNALKYSHDTVRVSLSVDDDCAKIAVTDTGIGMTSSEQEQMFKPYYRSKRSQMQEVSGMGLGLFIVKRGIEANGGEICVDSKVGKGSTLTICLPVGDEQLSPQSIPVRQIRL